MHELPDDVEDQTIPQISNLTSSELNSPSEADPDGELKLQKDELYDSEADDSDERYYSSMTATQNADGSTRVTDAVLSCAMCLTPVCYDCQRYQALGLAGKFYVRHCRYPDQYRAMFVCNVELNLAEILLLPDLETVDPRELEASKPPSKPTAYTLDSVEDPAQLLDGNSFFAAHCRICHTLVGVYDHVEVYHLFRVIASPP
ncbi:hypothetical protein L0F63_003153 [Massospora cicadina]|nr:hypothetical protein L0F63_003153 [Massospora cicadina]